MSDERTVGHPSSSTDFPTNDDRVCANAIAQALMGRYGHVRLSERYRAARVAMDVAEASAQDREARFRRWLAEGEPVPE